MRRHTSSAPGLALMVEDDPATREVLRRMLESDGWSVKEASNGREALACVEQCRPGLIVLDLMMPEMDGFEFLARAARARAGPDDPGGGGDGPRPVGGGPAVSQRLHDARRLRRRVLQKGGFSREDLLREVRDLLGARK